MGNCLYFAYTKVRYPGARLVRLPFYLRGRKHFSFGKGLTLGYGCRFDLDGEGKTLKIGNNCKFNDRVHIVAHESVTIGNHVLMASNIFISDTNHGDYTEMHSNPSSKPDLRELVTAPISIGDNVWIGEGACVMPGVTLGVGCVVGSNAVVTHSFPDNVILAGVPAKVIKVWDAKQAKWIKSC